MAVYPARFALPARSARPGPGRLRRLVVALALALAGGAIGAQPRVDAQGDIRYRVVPGDTLTGIGQRLLEPPERWRDVQRLNGIKVPRHLAPGTELRIDPSWMRGEAASLTLGAVGGAATLDGAPAASGAVGREGSRVETGPDGVVVVQLRDGTTLTIPPASSVRFERLRQYLGTDSIEAQIGIDRGGVETRSAPGRRRGLQIRTPAATAAVRGTEFRVRARPEDTAVEVLTGTVGAAGPGGRAELPAGQGAIATPSGPPRVEALLAAPALGTLPTRIRTPAAVLRFSPVEGAVGYRVRVARDADFTRLVAETSGAEPEVAIVSREDGTLHVSARAVSAIGLQGREARGTVEVAARPEPPLPMRPPERGVLFERDVALVWTEPAGVGAYRVQVAADPAFGTPVLDTIVTTAGASFELPELREGTATWWWRIASRVGPGPDAREGPFSEPRALEQRPIGGAPGGSVDDDRLELAWPALPGHTYELQLAAEPAFAAPLLERRLDAPRATIEGLGPGVYWTRTRSIDPKGVASPFGPPQRFEIKSLLRSGMGAPVGSGAGSPVETPGVR